MNETPKSHTVFSRFQTSLLGCALVCLGLSLRAAPFDAAPFSLPLPEGNGLMWEDPREIHHVVVRFAAPPSAPDKLRLEYWGSRWPEQRIPKDSQPGGGSVGWMEMGNWYTYKWRVADTEVRANGNTFTFTFRPLNAKEFPQLKDYPADFRFTLKIRVAADAALPKVEQIEAYTDSELEPKQFRLAWQKLRPPKGLQLEVFNGKPATCPEPSRRDAVFSVEAVKNSDPNTFDRTLVTVRSASGVFTFKVDDLEAGPLFLPDFGVAVTPATDQRDYAAIAADVKSRGVKTLYDRVGELPEQTWRSAWEGMPPKKSHIYVPLGLDGGRQRFRLDADGTIRFRSNDAYLTRCAGRETPRFGLEPAPVRFRFLPPMTPAARTIAEASMPICETTWETNGVRITQTGFATALDGTNPDGPVPRGDTLTVFLGKFVFTNTTGSPQAASLPLSYRSGDKLQVLRFDESGLLWLGNHLRGEVLADVRPAIENETLRWSWTLTPGESRTLLVKIPYIVLTEKAEQTALAKLDFDREGKAVADYWRRRLDESARLITPEPMLNEFYRAHAGHLLINCEREPGAERRFARVGSFSYGTYGNESCMMVVDLERRGYHREAQECLDAWLHFQGTASLPGDFSSQKGVLYGACGVEEGGYNQHHGWILWMLAEHYRFTRDDAWLQRAAPGILAGADWIINETRRTAHRHELERGLLPAGRLEDIEDWWTWLSTSCYTWRGLDSAAWALEQAKHPAAARIRAEAAAYHQSLVSNFRKASQRSPVVRLRDGTAVPHIPSMAHRRGRYFGWICETLEGSLHLLITRALDPRSPEAEWILKDYEDNRYISNQYGYLLDNFDEYWFGRGGMSMQACLLLDVEPYLYRDEPKHALRALFNAQAVSYFPDERMNTEHALPAMGDWAGDHYKSSDESNSAGWLRYLFVREEGDTLLVGQAVPREWLRPGQTCGIQRTSTYFGPTSVLFTGGTQELTARLEGPTRNPPKHIRLRFRAPNERPLTFVAVNGKPWKRIKGEWVELPGNIGVAEISARFAP